MRKLNAFFSGLFVTILCCSMSQCVKNDTPKPITKIHGFVRDYQTGEGIANASLHVNQNYHACTYCDYQSTDYGPVTTASDGSYSLTFNPIGDGDYRLILEQGQAVSFNNVKKDDSLVKLGSDTVINIPIQKNFKLNLHLINSTDHGKSYFYVYTALCCSPNFTNLIERLDMPKVKVDTNLTFKMPEFTQIYVRGFYYNLDVNKKITDTLTTTKSFTSGKRDTSITIVNP